MPLCSTCDRKPRKGGASHVVKLIHPVTRMPPGGRHSCCSSQATCLVNHQFFHGNNTIYRQAQVIDSFGQAFGKISVVGLFAGFEGLGQEV